MMLVRRIAGAELACSGRLRCGWQSASIARGRDTRMSSAALNSIRTDELRQHVDYLASDQSEGREAGSAGGQRPASTWSNCCRRTESRGQVTRAATCSLR